MKSGGGESRAADSGSLTYLVLICLVATLGGLLFGYDTAVISGAIGFLQTHFELDSTLKGLGSLVGARRMHARGSGGGRVERPVRPAQRADCLGRAVPRFGHRHGDSAHVQRVHRLSHSGRSGRGGGLDGQPDVHRRDQPRRHPRTHGLGQSVGHRRGDARRLFRQLFHRQAGQRGVERPIRLALDVCLRRDPLRAAVGAAVFRPRKPAIPDEARQGLPSRTDSDADWRCRPCPGRVGGDSASRLSRNRVRCSSSSSRGCASCC